MFNFFKTGAAVLLMAGLAMGVAACSDDDPNYDSVTPPTVAVAPNTLTGVVADLNGRALKGAKVSLGAAVAETDANGMYLFGDVKPGTYDIKAEAAGKLAKEGRITVNGADKSQHLVWNANLAADVKVEVAASATDEAQASVETEALEGNDKAEVTVQTTVPAGAVDADEEVKVIVAPIYDAADVETKTDVPAGERLLMCGAALSCSKEGVKLTKAIELGFDLDAEMAASVVAMQYANGQWKPVNSRVEGGKVLVEAREFAAYGLFMGVKFSAQENKEAVTFEQGEWDNLYGKKDIKVDVAKFSYKSGMEINIKATTVLAALLVEKMAQRYGATVATLQGSYPLNVTLPVGTALKMSGMQSKLNVTARAMGQQVSGTHYGTVTVTATTYNRQHNGGGNQ